MSIKPCPACKSDNLDLGQSIFSGKWSRFCAACGTGGPAADSKSDAEAKWNAMPRRGDGLAWRSEPPDKPGWWWCKARGRGRAFVFRVHEHNLDRTSEWAASHDIWSGPLPEPPAPDAEKEAAK